MDLIRDIVANKDRDSYLELFKIIEENSSDIRKEKEARFYISSFDLGYKSFNYNSLTGLKVALFVYKLSENHKIRKISEQREISDFLIDALKDSGISFKYNKVRGWINQCFLSDREYTHIYKTHRQADLCARIKRVIRF